jgi:nitroreductase
MELIETLRTTGAVRDFLDEEVPDEVLFRILDTARFAPSGGNRQGWHVVVVKDAATRSALRDLYLTGWYEYLALGAAGLVPWSPLADRDAEQEALALADDLAHAAAQGPGGFAEHLDLVPALLLVFADLGALAAVDRDAPRYTFAGGASVYPFTWSVLLAARQEGLAGVMTTMPIRRENDVKELLAVPEGLALAALVALGRPQRQIRKLGRRPVSEFSSVDRFDGPAFGAPAGQP